MYIYYINLKWANTFSTLELIPLFETSKWDPFSQTVDTTFLKNPQYLSNNSLKHKEPNVSWIKIRDT